MSTQRSIQLKPVSSSNLAAVGYDSDAHVLAVQFASGHIFYYADVPAKAWDGLEAAPSKGQYYAHEIKGHFSAEKVTGTCECGDVGDLGETCADCGCGVYTQASRA